ncbi:MAG: tetratricopeptide repeat protein [Desulfobacterales bacterium]|jgi:tetratricopeptide (TPR) repeat protein|nr:tetratricopeptide repeat protein [Desulfobacterales bacterium]
MTFKPLDMYHPISTESQFLLSSTDAPEKTAPSGIDPDSLKPAFPELITGQALVTASLKRLAAQEVFSILVLRLDPIAEEKAGTALLALAEAIDTECAAETGWWGIIDSSLFVSFFPDKNDQACLETGQVLNSRLAAAMNATVSGGIGAFPTADYSRNQILDNAYKALDHAAFFGPGSLVLFDDVSLNISGDHLFQKGDIPGAMAEFEKALLLAPANVNVCNSLGVCHSLLGNFDRAQEMFQRALALAPDEFMAHYNLGLVHLLTDNREVALRNFLEAHRLGGDVYEVALQTGRLYLEINNPTEAFSYLQKALQLQPGALAFRLMGDYYSVLSQNEDAFNAYRQAVKLNPNDAAALSALGLLYEDKGENPEIGALFCEKSIEIAPNEGKFRHRLGKLYLKQNRLEDALAAFQAAMERGYDSTRYIEEINNLRDVTQDQAC